MKIVSFGCRSNTFESAVIKKMLASQENLIVVNTCAVTHEAERQCQQMIRKLKAENPNAFLVVTGCAAQLNPDFYSAMPEVDKVVGNADKLKKEAFLSEQKVCVSDLEKQQFDIPVIADFEDKVRAFLQIQTGCNHHCTFCITRLARGKSKGLPIDRVVWQAKELVRQGWQEITLTGIDLLSYPLGFCALVRELLHQVPTLKRLRFGSVDPACLDDDFIKLYQDFPQLMPYLHLSVQSGDDAVLKLMGRRHCAKNVIDFAKKIRAVRPDMVLGADFITGFPTETEDQFKHTCDLVEQANITHLHVFPYSQREGTPAAQMVQVPVVVRKERAKKLRELGELQKRKLLDSYVGQKVLVLIEKDGSGLEEHYLRVETNSEETGKSVPVLITQRRDDGLVGKI